MDIQLLLVPYDSGDNFNEFAIDAARGFLSR